MKIQNFETLQHNVENDAWNKVWKPKGSWVSSPMWIQINRKIRSLQIDSISESVKDKLGFINENTEF